MNIGAITMHHCRRGSGVPTSEKVNFKIAHHPPAAARVGDIDRRVSECVATMLVRLVIMPSFPPLPAAGSQMSEEKPKRWYRWRWLPLVLAVVIVGNGWVAIEWRKATKLQQSGERWFGPPTRYLQTTTPLPDGDTP